MKTIFLTLIISFVVGTVAQADFSGRMTYLCQVKNYDKELVDLNCASVDKPILMRTPASWLPKKFKLQRDAKLSLSLTMNQVDQWSQYNPPTSTKSKRK